MHVEIIERDLEPFKELQRFQEMISLHHNGEVGACATFIGSMRDSNEGDNVKGMHIEHYPQMTEKHLLKLCSEVETKWNLIETLMIHRVGNLSPNDPIVVIAAWSAHRKEAFEACRFMMENLKSKAPFWKKELLSDGGSRWIEKNTPGY